VNQLAADLGYEPNNAAIHFKQKRTSMIGVIVPRLSQDFFVSVVNGIEDIAYKNKYTVLLCQSRDNVEREKQLVDAMKSNRVDGMLISISKNTRTYDHFELFKKYNIPVVFFDRIPNMPDIHYVASDLKSGIEEAIGFLSGRNHKNIALINGPENLMASQERREGFEIALKKNRIKFQPSFMVGTDLSKEGTGQAMKTLLSLKKRPTAVIAFNDYVAMDAIQCARKSNIRVNKDITFVSFANETITEYTENPPVASIEQFPYQQGEKAMELLMQLMEKNGRESPVAIMHHLLLQSRLVIRDSRNG
jgi:LacI family transcriptional regulator